MSRMYEIMRESLTVSPNALCVVCFDSPHKLVPSHRHEQLPSKIGLIRILPQNGENNLCGMATGLGTLAFPFCAQHKESPDIELPLAAISKAHKRRLP